MVCCILSFVGDAALSESSHIGLSHARALQRQLDITANNIANANTAGFKGERPVFEPVVPGGAVNAKDASAFVIDRGSYIDTQQGSVTRTDNPLDIAVGGKGWLSYQTPEGQVAYGRDGSLTMDPEGAVVTTSGAQLLDEGGAPIVLPQGLSDLKISPDGTITAAGTGPLARIGVFDVPDIQSFKRLGAGMMVPVDGAANTEPAANPGVIQGALEGSNVNPVREMTRLIDVQRAYERTTQMMDNDNGLTRDMLQRISRPA